MSDEENNEVIQLAPGLAAALASAAEASRRTAAAVRAASSR